MREHQRDRRFFEQFTVFNLKALYDCDTRVPWGAARAYFKAQIQYLQLEPFSSGENFYKQSSLHERKYGCASFVVENPLDQQPGRPRVEERKAQVVNKK